MVYNFALPPLILHTFYGEDATVLSKWANELRVDSDVATFFNILDTHDGIGLMGVKELLLREDIDFIVQNAKEHGALISYKMTEAMTEEPYEINSTWWSAMNADNSDEDVSLQVRRFVASRSIAAVLQGVPAVYAHGALGTPNDHGLVKKTKHNRDINRGVIDSSNAPASLKDPNSKLSLIRRYTSKLSLARTGYRAFHPHGAQRVLMLSSDVFTVLRTSPEKDQHILAMTNVTNRVCNILVQLSELGLEEITWYDILGDTERTAQDGKLDVTMQPYDVIWLIPSSEKEFEENNK
jgi:sucrose phosphorylase